MSAVGGAVRKLKLALIQLAVSARKSTSLERAGSLVRTAASEGAKLVALPECFNCPYGVKYFPEYAEPIPDGDSSKFLSSLAKECEVFLVGGSIPEKSDGKLYNTCVVYGPDGTLLGKYRKMHLFDIDIPGGIRFQESEVLSPGQDFFTFNAGEFKVGIGICYDIRFQELASIYNQKGCQLLLYPGAFNMVTGPMHWELLARGRAADNQCYVGVVSPARDEQADYVAYGHSLLVDPWAKVVDGIGAEEGVVYAELDLDQVDKVRTNIPISRQKQLLVYSSAQAKQSQ